MTFCIAMRGRRFNRLLVLEEAAPYISPSGKAYAQWRCLCDCGKRVVVLGSYLRSGHTQSCGCLQRERSTTHGMSKTSIYWIYVGMHQRCYDSNSPPYKNYGGRGIKVCEHWHSFENFYADMGDCPEGLTLERIDNDGNYESGNCKWATRQEQNLNARGVGIFTALAPMGNLITAKGITKFARDHELQQACISLCLAGKQKQHKGWKFKRLGRI